MTQGIRGGLTAAWIATFCALPARAIEREVVISAYQGPCQNGKFAENLATVRRVVGEGLARKSDFIVFPETFLSGYESPDVVRAGARPLDDPELTKFIGESADHQAVILVGLARVTSEGLYNTILVIQRGKLLGMYDKILLTGGDRDVLKFLPGRSMPVFEAHGVKFGVIVCHDSSFPQPAFVARLKGAEILFSPHYNYIHERAVDDHRRSVRNNHVGLAAQLKFAVVRSNVVVTDRPHEPGYGDSFILSPQGEPLAEARLFKTELITARVNPKMFGGPSVWANLRETPPWLNEELAELLKREAERKRNAGP